MITAKITSTTPYSSGGKTLRLSQTHSTRNARPRNTSTPPTIIRGISSITEAPKTTPARGTAAAISPATLASTLIRSARAVRLRAW